MADKVVFNADAMEQERSNLEAALNRQISSMEATKAQYEADAANLESEATNLDTQAQAQEHIAATAMMTVRYTDSKGRSRSKQVPDTAKRAAAAAKARDLRSRAAALSERTQYRSKS